MPIFPAFYKSQDFTQETLNTSTVKLYLGTLRYNNSLLFKQLCRKRAFSQETEIYDSLFINFTNKSGKEEG